MALYFLWQILVIHSKTVVFWVCACFIVASLSYFCKIKWRRNSTVDTTKRNGNYEIDNLWLMRKRYLHFMMVIPINAVIICLILWQKTINLANHSKHAFKEESCWSSLALMITRTILNGLLFETCSYNVFYCVNNKKIAQIK